MKFFDIFKIITEDRIDNLVTTNPSAEKYKDLLKEIYNSFDLKIQSNAKFNKFLDFLLKNTEKLLEYKEKMKEIYEGYVKYNLDLSKYELESLWKYIEDKENLSKFVIDPTLAKKIYEDNEKVVILPLNREGSVKYGSKTWCISRPANGMWISYMKAGKLSNFVLYKTSNAIHIPELAAKNWNITNVQVDLDGKLYITDTGNTVGAGVIDGNNADTILKFMKLNKSIFKSFNDQETFKLIADNNPEIVDVENDNSPLYPYIIKYMGGKVPIHIELLNAIRISDISKVKELLQNPELDINRKVNNGSNAFRTALDSTKFDIAKLLLDTGKVDLSPITYGGENMNIIEYYIHINDIPIVEFLIDNLKDIKINFKKLILTSHGSKKEALNFAAKKMNYTISKDMILLSLILSGDQDKNVFNNNYPKIVELINDPTCNINAEFDVPEYGRAGNFSTAAFYISPFVAAATRYSKNVNALIQLFLENPRFNINYRFKNGYTAFEFLVRTRHNTSAEYILDNAKNLEINIKKISKSSKLYLKISNKIQQEVPIEKLWWIALYTQNIPALEKLIANKKFNINLRDSTGVTGLMYLASKHGYYFNTELRKTVLKLLQRKDLDINAESKSGNTALLNAITSNYDEVLEFLLKRKDLDINHTRKHDNYSALNLVIKNSNIATIKSVLSRKDINVNNQDINGDTPLMFACKNKDKTNIQLLLAHKKIDLTLKNKAGQTAYDLAAEQHKKFFPRK